MAFSQGKKKGSVLIKETCIGLLIGGWGWWSGLMIFRKPQVSQAGEKTTRIRKWTFSQIPLRKKKSDFLKGKLMENELEYVNLFSVHFLLRSY